MARQYNMRARMQKAYQNYIMLYDAKKAMLEKQGFRMKDVKLNTLDAYIVARNEAVRDGITRNINKTIVSKQAYTYGRNTAISMKAAAEKFDLSWKDKSVTDLMHIDRDEKQDIIDSLSKIYKEKSDEFEKEEKMVNGKLIKVLSDEDRQALNRYISYEVFGSE